VWRTMKGERIGCGCNDKRINTRREADYWRNRIGSTTPAPHDENRSSYNVTTSYILLDGGDIKLPADLGKTPALHPGLSSDGNGNRWQVGVMDRLVRNIALAGSVEQTRRQGFKKKPLKKI